MNHVEQISNEQGTKRSWFAGMASIPAAAAGALPDQVCPTA